MGGRVSERARGGEREGASASASERERDVEGGREAERQEIKGGREGGGLRRGARERARCVYV